jgi:hypothetical protein
MKEPPPRAGGEKKLPLRAELDGKCGGHVGGGGGAADLLAWFAADGHGGSVFLVATGGLAPNLEGACNPRSAWRQATCVPQPPTSLR